MPSFAGEALEVLRSIRDEVRSTREVLSTRLDETNARLDQTNARLDQTNARLEQTREELSAGFAATNEHLGHVGVTLRELSTQQTFMVRSFATFARRDRRFDDELEDLRDRMKRVEGELGIDEPDPRAR